MGEVRKGKLTELKPDKRNANRGTKRGLAALDHSIRQYGVGRGIVVDKNGVIIGGNKTAERLADLGIEDIVVVPTDGKTLVVTQRTDLDLETDKAARELAYSDNRVASLDLEWEPDEITFDLANGVDLSAMFTEKELAELGVMQGKEGEEPAGVQTDRFEEIAKKWQTSDGQLWQLGNHRILCGDSLRVENIKRLLGEDTPALVLADPPYGVNIVDLTGSVGASKPFGSKKDRAVRGSVGAAHVVEVGKYPVIIGDEDTETAKKAVALYQEQYPKAVQVWWGANYYSPVLPASMCWLVWYKETTGNFADCELAWTNQDKAARLFQHRWNGMLRDSEHERRWHPTQKPAALAAWVYEQLTEPGAIIVDPFGGAGWSVLGGEQSGRYVRAIEKSPEYIAVILERWSIQTGITPVLLDQSDNSRKGQL